MPWHALILHIADTDQHGTPDKSLKSHSDTTNAALSLQLLKEPFEPDQTRRKTRGCRIELYIFSLAKTPNQK
jgi:hypothetical protein